MKILILVFLFLPFSLFAQLRGKVVSISDGDTFTILTEEKIQIKIRLYGIDCPEKGQEFGQVCKEYLSKLIFNKLVEVENKGYDRFKRTLGVVFVNQINVNEKMLEEGMAWHFKKYDRSLRWSLIEEKAKSEKRGLWSNPNFIAPWEYRKNKTKQ